MSLGIIMLVTLILLIVLGVPVAFAIGVASMGAILLGNYQLVIMPQKVFAGLNSFPTLAIPFFILAGNLMTVSGINDKIMKFARSVAGWLRGSLSIITIVASAIFAAISGSGTATVSAIGGICIPSLKDEGYPPEFAAAVSGSASILGPLIPPSIILIVYGNAAQLSISKLFSAAVIPGVLMAGLFIAYCYFKARKMDMPAGKRLNIKEVARETKSSIWALLMPVIILGGIFGGVFTATEAAAVSVIYAVIIGVFVYRTINLKNIWPILTDSCITAAILLFLLGASKISSWVLAVARVPEAISSGLLSVSSNSVITMLMVNAFLLLVGMFMEANVAVVILTPILLPIAEACGLTGIQFGVMMCINLCIGLITPPVGLCILLANDMADTKLELTMKETMPFIAVALVVLLMATYIQPMTMWLANSMG